VVEESVDGRRGQCLGHDGVEAGQVKIAGHGETALFVGGVDHAVEGFSLPFLCFRRRSPVASSPSCPVLIAPATAA